MNVSEVFKHQTRPLVAILRGITEEQVVPIAQVLLDEGICVIEVPLNSPDALRSISRLVNEFGGRHLVGAGTVTDVEKARAVIDTGAKLVVTPNTDTDVIEQSVAAGCLCLPGVATPTEAFSALKHGAQGIKIFPATQIGVPGFKALMSVLPDDTWCFPVGGISSAPETMQPYLAAGAKGFGFGASLYTPHMSLDRIRDNARSIVRNFDDLCGIESV